MAKGKKLKYCFPPQGGKGMVGHDGPVVTDPQCTGVSTGGFAKASLASV